MNGPACCTAWRVCGALPRTMRTSSAALTRYENEVTDVVELAQVHDEDLRL